MILPDVNVLVYAYRTEYQEHDQYRSWLEHVLRGSEDLALLDPVLIGFARLVTHPSIFERPAPLPEAMRFVTALRTSRLARPLAASDAVWEHLGVFGSSDRMLRGNLVPDAFIAAAAVVSGARVATADAGFARFPGVEWFDPVQVT